MSKPRAFTGHVNAAYVVPKSSTKRITLINDEKKRKINITSLFLKNIDQLEIV
jgi:hypothetical protein